MRAFPSTILVISVVLWKSIKLGMTLLSPWRFLHFLHSSLHSIPVFDPRTTRSTCRSFQSCGSTFRLTERGRGICIASQVVVGVTKLLRSNSRCTWFSRRRRTTDRPDTFIGSRLRRVTGKVGLQGLLLAEYQDETSIGLTVHRIQCSPEVLALPWCRGRPWVVQVRSCRVRGLGSREELRPPSC